VVAAVAPHQGASRRLWPVFEKRRIVELTMRKGASIRAIAREQGVHPTSLSHWRRLYRAGTLGTQSPSARRACASAANARFLPVTVAAAMHPAQLSSDSHAGGSGVIELTLSSGSTLRIEIGTLDAGFVCALVAQLQR